jgi:hypothetical protein
MRPLARLAALALVVLSLAACSARAQDVDSRLLESLQKLPDGAAIPAPLFERPDLPEVAATLVQRLRAREAANPPVVALDMRRDTELHLYFWFGDAAAVARTGFKNTFQVYRARNELSQPRHEAENRLLGLKIADALSPETDHPSHRLRPVYAAVQPRVPGDFGRELGCGLYGYGNAIAVLSDRVKARATWTPGDSVRSPQFKARTFSSDPAPGFRVVDGEYIEAQIFGGVTLADVEYFMLAGMTPPPDDEARAFARAVHPVEAWRAETARRDGRCVHVRTKRIPID